MAHRLARFYRSTGITLVWGDHHGPPDGTHNAFVEKIGYYLGNTPPRLGYYPPGGARPASRKAGFHSRLLRSQIGKGHRDAGSP